MEGIIRQIIRRWLIKGKGQLPKRWSVFAFPAIKKFLRPIVQVFMLHSVEPIPSCRRGQARNGHP
jgi:hypothetical protein